MEEEGKKMDGLHSSLLLLVQPVLDYSHGMDQIQDRHQRRIHWKEEIKDEERDQEESAIDVSRKLMKQREHHVEEEIHCNDTHLQTHKRSTRSVIQINND